jgi:hypothetical protein
MYCLSTKPIEPQDILRVNSTGGSLYFSLVCPLCKEKFPENHRKKLEAYV